MSYSGSAVRSTARRDPALVGTVLQWVGLGILALTVPVVTGALAGLVATAGSPAGGVGLAVRAMDGPLLGGAGLSWLFHGSALALLCGCWLLGAGLLLEGLFD